MSSPPDPERAFANQAEAYRQILDAIADMILVKGAHSRILWANKAFRDYYGMSNEELLGIIDASFSPPDRSAKYVLDDAHVFVAGEALDITDEPVTRHDGVVQIFNTVKSPIRDQDGKVRMTVGVSRNITEWKRVEEDLARYREHLERLVAERTEELSITTDRLQTILAALAEGIVATNADGAVLLMNPAAAALTGWPASQATGQEITDLLRFTPETSDHPFDSVRLGELVGNRGQVTGLLESRSGIRQLVSVQAAPLLGDDGTYRGSVLVLREVGLEREVAEQRLRNQKLESVGLLAGGIAHDFNNILAGILGSVSVARHRLASGEGVDDLLEKAESACIRAQGLTTRLLTFARGGTPVKKILTIATTVREAAELGLSGSSVRLDFSCDDPLHLVEADEGQIAQAIHSLILNARQAMPAGGRVQISVRNSTVRAGDPDPLHPGDSIQITVSDTGVGITPADLPRVFDPYFSTRPGGTGLGLASVHSIVKRHGGHVTASSTPGLGSTFSIFLPAAPGIDPSHEGTTREVIPRKLLILDDDPGVRQAIAAMLSIDDHDAVLTSGSSEAFLAFDAARQSGAPFDAVLVDLTMPGDLGGIEVIRELQKRDPSVRLVVMSGYSEDAVMSQSQELGLAGILQKPFGVATLRAILARI